MYYYLFFIQVEMKNLMKGQIPQEYALDYDKTFSEQSEKIYGKLIPELKKLMEGHFNPSVTQMSNWLRSMHKHKRDRQRKRQSGQLDKDDRRMHINSRLSEVSSILFNILLFFFELTINFYIFDRKETGESSRP